MTTRLAHQTQKAAGIPNGMRTATVTAVSSSAVTISVSGGSFSAGVGVVTSYAPRVGDVVAVFRQDSSWLILGPTSAVNGWQSMAALGYLNGWTDVGGGLPIGQFRVCAEEVRLVGELTVAVAPSNGQTIVAGLPAAIGQAVMVASLGSSTVAKVRLVVTSAGLLQIYDAGTAIGPLQFSCSYPLDARTA